MNAPPPRHPPRSKPGAARAPRPAAPVATAATPAPLTEDELDALQRALDAVPAPLEPLDVSALDGYLVGVLLQPQRVPESHWLPGVTDVDGRPLPAGCDATRLHGLVRRRHAELDHAIGRRDWFDPWIFQFDEGDESDEGHDDGDGADGAPGAVQEAVLPWVAGFAAAQDRCPALMAIDDPELVEPLALLYLHFDRDDLEDADALLEVIDTLEPPTDLAEAVQDVVRAVMLIADVSRPRPKAPAAPGPRRPGPPRGGRPGPRR